MLNDPEIRSIQLPYRPRCVRSLWRGELLTDNRWLMPEIVSVVARTYGVSEADLMAKNPSRRLAIPKAHAMWLMSRQSHLSFPMIGRFFGLHHSTVVSARDAHAARVAAREIVLDQFPELSEIAA